MQLALIPPNSQAQMMKQTGLHLLLPETVQSLGWGFVRSLPGYRILDNGAAEGKTASLDELTALLMDGGCFDEVVAPDQLKDMEAAIQGAGSMAPLADAFPKLSVMGVAQGENMAQVFNCIKAFAWMPWIKVIGLPRVLNEQFGMTARLGLAQAMAADEGMKHLQLHCLGASYWFAEEIRYLATLPNVRSMDSSLPFVLAWHNLRLGDRVHVDIKRPTDYFSVTQYANALLHYNINQYMRWAEAPND